MEAMSLPLLSPSLWSPVKALAKWPCEVPASGHGRRWALEDGSEGVSRSCPSGTPQWPLQARGCVASKSRKPRVQNG